LFLALVHQLVRLGALWEAVRERSEAVMSLPMGLAVDRLPRRLTSRFGSFLEAIQQRQDVELAARFAQADGAIETAMARLKPEAAGVLGGASGVPWPARLAAVLEPVWRARGPLEAYADLSSARGEAGVSQAVRSLLPDGMAETDAVALERAVEQAEDRLAMELVRHLNQYMDLVWNRLAVVTVLGLGLMALVTSYPFQPAGALFNWMLTVVLLAVGVIVGVLAGINRNELFARINKIPAGRSLWNLDFLGKLTAYVAPLLGLLALLSAGVSDLLRLIVSGFTG
jgi:hypothetical protein